MREADCSLLKCGLVIVLRHTDGGTAVESVLDPRGSSLNLARQVGLEAAIL